MKKQATMIGAIGLIIGLLAVSVSYAGEIDLLLEKLVDKGVLTGAEAQQVKYETQEKVKKEIATGKSESMPKWIQNMKLKGDLRLRYQYKHEKAANDYSKDTNIGRVRMRLGLESKINEKIMAGIGIATGSNGDPRSTNVTFGASDGGYSTKFGIRLDNAYAKYEPLSWLSLVGGKMLLKDVFWEPTDLIWDTDITPEGAVIGFKKNINSETSVFMQTGGLVMIADTSSNVDPTMAYLLQAGATHKVNDTLSLKGSLTMYNFSNVKGTSPSEFSSASNTGITKPSGSDPTGAYTYNYNMLNPALELSIKEPFKALGLNVESLKFLGEYVNNLAAPDKNSGFSLGFKMGNSKIEKWGDWQIKYIYAMLEKDAVLDVLPDSDRLGGKTGMRSHEVELQYGLGKNTFLGLDVYRSWNIKGGAKAPETLVQLDWNMKF
ncbi:MAG: putative porin [Candidatus Omnitrophica bacterium]|nr:putative porin [Candidatus Omnitrophota bacterium]